GAYVTNVTPGSPADKAGIQGANNNREGIPTGGDLIIGIDGLKVDQFDTLLKYLINNKSPGDSIDLTILRDGEEINLTLILGKRP
ncbi:MAG TPA: PDZ domain-containing protein, partial [Anaerolineales bacterium]|nr:PDZ domain-containing protein [Anaerolineales bacterium]